MATLAVTNSFSAGTTIVAADVNQNFDDVEAFVNSAPGVIQNDIVDAKGDIVAATASDAVARVAVGSDGQVLTADSTAGAGVAWSAAPADATKMPLAGGTFTGAVTFDGASPIVLEGATDDGFETTVAVTDPTADRTITLPDATGTVLTSGNPNDNILSFNAQTGTTYTFVLTDGGKMVTSSNGSAQTFTVPPNSSVAFPVGTQIIVQNIGSANCTLAQGSGVTIQSKDSNKEIDGQYAAATLIKTATDTWSLIGALA